MSGTSLDGVDLAHIHFKIEEGKWEFEILECETIEYDINWVNRLKVAVDSSDDELTLLNKEYQFCMDNTIRIQKKANKIYEMVTTNRKQILTDNSCDFHILEAGYQEYIEKVLNKQSK